MPLSFFSRARAPPVSQQKCHMEIDKHNSYNRFIKYRINSIDNFHHQRHLLNTSEFLEFISQSKAMALEETVEERAARKLAKREARDKTAKVTDEAAPEKTSKKRKAVEEDDEAPVKSSKALKQSASDDAPRRRTRSISNAEEVYPVGMSPEDFRKEHQLQVTGNADSGSGQYVCPAPMTAFAMTPFAQPIRKALDAAGFPNPTPTQAQVWPIALSGRDVITVAKTGSGKEDK